MSEAAIDRKVHVLFASISSVSLFWTSFRLSFLLEGIQLELKGKR